MCPRSISTAFLITVALSVPPASAQSGDDPGQVHFRGASFPVAEEAGEVTVVVKRQRGDSGDVTVEWGTTDGSATEGVDYVAAAGVLAWADGDQSDKSFTVEILDDDESEGLETFGVLLSNPTGGVTVGSPGTTVVHINPSDRSDDDPPGDDEGPGVIKLTAAAFPAFESAGTAEFTVVRKKGSLGAVSVDFGTVDGSAVAGEDYTETSGTLSWADGEDGTKSVAVPLVDDDLDEGLETISVVLTNATGGASLGERDVASILIIDDDSGAGGCVPDEQTLCLGDGRFQITGQWTDFSGASGPFHAVPASDDTGLVWFFDDSNIELLIKVLDGCPVNDHFWVFYGATTNVGFAMEVIDTTTGASRRYENPLGTTAEPATDVTAFACP